MKILNVSDIHLGWSKPRCRQDPDWVESQQNIVDFVVKTAIEEKVDYIIDNGDTFDVPVQPLAVINIIPNALERYKSDINWICMPGNHSLQYHQPKNMPKSALSTLGHCKKVTMLKCNEEFEAEFMDIPIVHRLIFPNLESVPFYVKDKGEGCYEYAELLLDRYPCHDLILTGDYHHSFHFEKDGRHVVNPGCANIQDAKMIEYHPKLAIIDYNPGKKVGVDWIAIPDNIELTSNEHILKVAKSEANIDGFLEKLEEAKEFTLDFWVDVENYMEENNILQDEKDFVLNEVKPQKET